MATKPYVTNSYQVNYGNTSQSQTVWQNSYDAYAGKSIDSSSFSDITQFLKNTLFSREDTTGQAAFLKQMQSLAPKIKNGVQTNYKKGETLADIFSFKDGNISFNTDVPQGNANFLSLGDSTSLLGQPAVPTDQVSIIGAQDSSLASFLSNTPAGTSGSGSSGSGGSYGGSGGSGGGGGSLLGGTPLPSMGGSRSTTSAGTSPVSNPNPSAALQNITDAASLTSDVANTPSPMESLINKRLKMASGRGRVDKVLGGEFLRTQTLLGR